MSRLASPRDSLAAAMEMLRSPQHGLPLDVDATGTTVVGSAFLAWLMARQLAGSLEESRQMARALVQRGFLLPVLADRVPFADDETEARYRLKDVAVSTKRRVLRNLSQQESVSDPAAPSPAVARAQSPPKPRTEPSSAPSAPSLLSSTPVHTSWLSPQSSSVPRAPVLRMGAPAQDGPPTRKAKRASVSLPSLPPLPTPAPLVVHVSHVDFEPMESFVSGMSSLTLAGLAASFAEAASVPLAALRLADAQGGPLALDTPLAAVPDRHVVVHYGKPTEVIESDPDAPDTPAEPPCTPPVPAPVVLSLPREVLVAVASELVLPPPPLLVPLSGRPEQPAPVLDERKRKMLLSKLEKGSKARKGPAPLMMLGEAHERLTDLARTPDVAAAVAAVCDHADVDGQVRLWRRLLGAEVDRVLVRLLGDEVLATTAQSTLFRSNNFTVGLLAAHTRAVCVPYLQDVLAPLLLDVVGGNTRVYELNVAKASPEQVEADTRDLVTLLDRFVAVFEQNTDRVPTELRTISHVLASTVAAKFPTAATIAVGGLFFLRIVCPSIVSPEGFGLLPVPVKPEARRTLVLVSKALQNVANHTPFKEAHMRALDAWLERATPRMAAFLQDLASLDANSAPASPETQEPLGRAEYAQVAAFLTRSMEKLRGLLTPETHEALAHTAVQVTELEAIVSAKKK